MKIKLILLMIFFIYSFIYTMNNQIIEENKLKEESLLLKYAESDKYSNQLEELLMFGANPNIKDILQQTPLHIATIHNALENVKILLKYHANPDIQDDLQYSALMTAVSKGYIDIVFELLKHKANPNLQDFITKETAIFRVADQNPNYSIETRKKIISLLLLHGAKLKIKNNQGETIIEYLIKHNLQELAQYIEEYIKFMIQK